MIFAVRQEQFEGPMAALLNLIEREQLKITEISLARVADDFIAHIRAMNRPDPEELAEFVVVAAELMLMKSRLLLPAVATEEDQQEEPTGELGRRLQEYRQLRAWAEELKMIAHGGRRIVLRELCASADPFFYPLSARVAPIALREACAALLAAVPKIERIREEKIGHLVSLEERISEIRAALRSAGEVAFSKLLPMAARERGETIVSFLGVLELVRAEFLEALQEEPFQDITVRRRS